MFRRLRWIPAVLVLLLLGWVSTLAGSAERFDARADVAAYIDEVSAAHGFDRDALRTLFAGARFRDDVIERISRPAESVWNWARYKSHLVDPARIRGGVAFWQTHADTLARAEREYGVPAEIIVAILGIETRYGEVRGSFPVLESLATLAFGYPPRATFFRSELTQFLLLSREEGKDPTRLTGSYAGAMGWGQFIASSFRHYAVDFDGDGVRDLWDNPVDAIGSVANYFHEHRWRGEHPPALPVRVRDARADAVAGTGLSLEHTVGELVALGVEAPDLPADLAARLYKVEGESGDEYWLALHDFYVITRYNRSHLYALAVHHIAQGLREQRAQVAAG